jgi:hypothetical protein
MVLAEWGQLSRADERLDGVASGRRYGSLAESAGRRGPGTSLKSEKGNVAIPLRRVDQVRLWNRNFLVPFLTGTFSLSLLASLLLPGGHRFRWRCGCGCGCG